MHFWLERPKMHNQDWIKDIIKKGLIRAPLFLYISQLFYNAKYSSSKKNNITIFAKFYQQDWQAN